MVYHRFVDFLVLFVTMLCLPLSVQGFDETVAPDLALWPDLDYVLEVRTSVSSTGATHRQYFSKGKARLETQDAQGLFVVIYAFTEDAVEETVLLTDEAKFFTNVQPYDEFLEVNDSFESLLYPTLPGEEMAMGKFRKVGESHFLGRSVEEWAFSYPDSGKEVSIFLFVDRQLRKILYLEVDGREEFRVTAIKLVDLPAELFAPPLDYEPFSY